MSQLAFAIDTIELHSVESTELVFLDDASYEFVGGGDAVNGY